MNEELRKMLTDLGLNEEQIGKLETEGVKEKEDITMLSAMEIKEASGCGVIVAKKIVAAFAPMVEAEKKEEVVVQTAMQPSIDVLPTVPDDISFISMLKIGGELKIGRTEVIAAIRATLADKTGLYNLPKVIISKMEAFAEEQEEPCGKDYYELQKLVTRHNYSEIFAALDIDSASVTQARKDKLLEKLATNLWPALYEYHQQLAGWVQAWNQGAANSTAMMTMLTAVLSGQRGMAAGMIQPPETSSIKDAAEGVIDKINKLFAGTGIVIARALALDANRIKEILENPTLPSQIGTTNREQMLKSLDVNVSADYVRLEGNLTRYALAVMELPKTTSGEAELSYLVALFQLGTQIPWDKLSGYAKENKARTKEVRPEEGGTFQHL